RRHTRFDCDWSSDVCSSDLLVLLANAVHEKAEEDAESQTAKQRQCILKNSRRRSLVLFVFHLAIFSHLYRRSSKRPGHRSSSGRSEERRVGKERRSGRRRYQ